ncbi:MAG: serine hydrolase [Acidimicrobiales bacterium]
MPGFAVVLEVLGSRRRIAFEGRRSFYAASTIKLALLVALFRAIDDGSVGLLDRIELGQPVVPVGPGQRARFSFPSALDGRPFELDAEERDAELAASTGSAATVGALAEAMITVSSNDATNLLLPPSGGPERVTSVARELGAGGVVMRRPIGDAAAARAGLSNEVDAAGLVRLLGAIARQEAASVDACRAMLEILKRQRFTDEIPSVLPASTVTASKNGWVTRILHDCALVFPADRPAYALAVLTSGFADQEAARSLIRAVSSWAWQEVRR